MRIREAWPVARTRQRRREFASVFDGVLGGSLGDGLEIGSGDGFLASMLMPYCRSFVATDSYRGRLLTAAQTPGLRCIVCDGTKLPFANGAFDFIFSTSTLEHVLERPAAFAEMSRCLRPKGLMVHILPSRTWKVLQLILYYPHLLIGAIDLALAGLGRLFASVRRRAPEPAAPDAPARAGGAPVSTIGHRWSDERNWRLSLKTILHGAVPRVHGEYPGHYSEWRGFGARSWSAEFKAAGFQVHQVVLLPLYSGYGFGLERLRAWGERRGLHSHYGFVLTKEGEAPPATLGARTKTLT